jgi:hypothetical protein
MISSETQVFIELKIKNYELKIRKRLTHNLLQLKWTTLFYSFT